MIEVRCQTEADTRAFARKLAATLRPGDVIVLAGGLGSGKTCFTSGLASGLGIEETVVSPSFVLAKHYTSGFLPLLHADVYRLGSLNEFDDLDVLDLASEGVLVIEWGDAVENVLPEGHLRVEFEVEEDDTRIMRMELGDSWQGRGIESL